MDKKYPVAAEWPWLVCFTPTFKITILFWFLSILRFLLSVIYFFLFMYFFWEIYCSVSRLILHNVHYNVSWPGDYQKHKICNYPAILKTISWFSQCISYFCPINCYVILARIITYTKRFFYHFQNLIHSFPHFFWPVN